jgi:hypothetical protein
MTPVHMRREGPFFLPGSCPRADASRNAAYDFFFLDVPMSAIIAKGAEGIFVPRRVFTMTPQVSTDLFPRDDVAERVPTPWPLGAGGPGLLHLLTRPSDCPPVTQFHLRLTQPASLHALVASGP